MRKVLTLAGIVFITCVYQGGWGAMWHVAPPPLGHNKNPGTEEQPFATIQKGIDAASGGDTVTVAQGTYVENIQFKGKNIVLTSTDPNDPSVVGNTVINGGNAGSVVTFDGTEDATCVLTGFTIRNGSAPLGAGINGARLGGGGTHARIENNVITSNNAEAYGGGLALCDGIIRNNVIELNSAGNFAGLYACDGLIESNTISGNSAAEWAGGLGMCGAVIQNNLIVANTGPNNGGLAVCVGIIRNNTIAYNSGGGLAYCFGVIQNCIIWGNGGLQMTECDIPTYSCIQGWTGGGTGNINLNPQFVDFTGGEYHLSQNSPCIGSGANQDWMWDAVDLEGNPRVIGAKVDMGAYEYETPTDTTPPYVSGREPAPGATRVLLGTNIVLHVKDHGSGVDETRILMRVNSLEVTPTIVGTPADYTVSYDPPSDFSYSEEVTVTVNAADLTSPANVMQRVTYSFTTIREPSPVAAWYVDGSVSISGDGTSWETAFKTIQDGIDAANDGDTVVVAKTAYAENIVFGGRNITLRSTDPLNPAVVAGTVIDGKGKGPVITFAGMEDATCVLAGFTVKNGNAAIGGGICGGTPLERSRATIEHNVITGNSANGIGGGLAWCDGMVQENTISGNTRAGLLFCDGTIRDNTISGNVELVSGLYCCDGVIERNLIAGNSPGGLSHCNGAIRQNLIVGNSAFEGGGILACNGAIRNNVILLNSASSRGGGVFWTHGTIQNCIVWGNSAPEGPQVLYAANTTYCCIQGWMGGGEGNISDDPLFVDADGPDNNPNTYEDNDYRPGLGSPCVDTGKNEDWMAGATSLNGGPRIMNGVVDMGAYEVREFIPPELILNGDPSMILECGAPYVEPGYTATDNQDGDITDKVIVTGSVDPTSPGTYALKYNVKDSSGNPAEKVRLVEVRDTTPPVITLLGDNPMTILVGTPYVEPGYTATDSCDGDVTAFVVVSGSVDSNTVGTYTLIYNAIDWSVNPAQVTRTVNVVAALPPIVVIGRIDGQIRLTWNSQLGETYTVWSCMDLCADGSWIEEETIVSQGDSTEWTDPETACMCKFYKIELK